MRATFRSWRSRRCRCQFYLDRFWREAALQRACDPVRAGDPGRLLAAAGLPNIDLRSPLITGLSLSLLLRADAAWLPALAGIIAIASKFIFRIDGKHIWNPAGFAIVVLLFTQHGVWISPGQWGTSVWLAALLVFFAILVLQAAQRSDIALFFLGSHAALLVARAVWLGDPLAIPLHQLQSGSLLIFAFFMISDPRTAPIRASAACCLPWPSRRWDTISRSSCKCGRRSMWR